MAGLDLSPDHSVRAVSALPERAHRVQCASFSLGGVAVAVAGWRRATACLAGRRLLAYQHPLVGAFRTYAAALSSYMDRLYGYS